MSKLDPDWIQTAKIFSLDHPVRKSLRMQNIDAETGLQSKKEPSLYFSSRKSTMDPRLQTEIANSNNGDHHFVFGNDSPRLPLEVNQGLLEFIWTEGCSGRSSNQGPALAILVL